MAISEQLDVELKDAMKAGDTRRRDVIRMIKSEAAAAQSQAGFSGEPDDEFYQSVIGSYVKKMDKSRQEYEELGERGAGMAEKLSFEVSYLQRWLPTKLGEAETVELIDHLIAELGVADDPKAAGRVTGQLMKTRGSDLDGALVNRLVRERLGAG